MEVYKKEKKYGIGGGIFSGSSKMVMLLVFWEYISQQSYISNCPLILTVARYF